MRLIDADELLKTLMEEIPLAENVNIFKDIIDAQPTAFDVDKVVEQFKNIAIEFEIFGITNDYVELSHAIEIVKEGGKAE